jgi:hypothetical protein
VLVGCLLSAYAQSSQAEESTNHSRKPTAAIHEGVLRAIVASRCQQMLCLVSIDRKPARPALLRNLEPLGRVDAASPDDFVFENGATRALPRRRAQIVDIVTVKLVAKSEALVDVAFHATALDSSTCRYRLRRVASKWEVDSQATQCTL